MDGSARPQGASLKPGGAILLRASVSPLAWRLMPAWAVVCGALASQTFPWDRAEWVHLLLTILLVDVGWGTLWAGIGGTDWASPLQRWREWPVGGRIAILPFTQAGSRGDHLSRWLGQLRAWWRQALWPACGESVLSIAAGLAVVALFSVALGAQAIVISLAALATMQLAAVWARGSGSPTSAFDAAVVVVLPWILVYAGFTPLTPGAVLLPALLAVTYACAHVSHRGRARATLAASIAAPGAYILASGQPVAAALSCALLLPQLLLIPWLSRGFPQARLSGYARPWIMVVMLAAALAS